MTTFSKKVKAEGAENAWILANRMMTLAAIFMSFVTLVGIAVAPWIADLLTAFSKSGGNRSGLQCGGNFPDGGNGAGDVSVHRSGSLSALVMGMLNARDVFGMPALASCFFNVGSMVVGGAAIGYWMDPSWGPRSLVGFSWGVVIGGVAQLVCQFPALRAVGYRFVADFKWNDPGVKKILQLMVAVIAASVTQVNVVVNSMFAYGGRGGGGELVELRVPPDAASHRRVRGRGGDGYSPCTFARRLMELAPTSDRPSRRD